MHDIRNLTISSTNPCLIVYLIDQSYSMSEQFGNASHSNAFDGTFAQPHKPTLKPSFAKEPPSQRTQTDTK
jgi:hypothetical protein